MAGRRPPWRARVLHRAAVVGLLLAPPFVSTALPRFAARSGMECVACHVNPSGGGPRNAYGAAVYGQLVLPASGVVDVAGEAPPDAQDEPFTGELTDWLRIGADVRTAYARLRPDHGVDGGAPELTSTFYLMQADLYHVARAGRLSLVLDVGVYRGFEAWGLLRPFATEGEAVDLLVKVGRFVPAFGIRHEDHQIFTREGIGLGAVDRDTGIELTAYLGPVAIQAGLFNGTMGDAPLDTAGRKRGGFEKAVATRASGRFTAGTLRAQVGGSFYASDNAAQVNPLLAGSVPQDRAAAVGEGVTDLRAGPFLTASLGRFTYLGEIILVRDTFAAPLPALRGYASWQALSVLLEQGVDLTASLEFREPDLELAGDSTTRVGAGVQWFPWSHVELHALVRRSFTDAGPTGGSLDLLAFLHLFL